MKYHQLHFSLFYILLVHELNGSTYDRFELFIIGVTRDRLKTHLKDMLASGLVERSEGSTEYREGRSNAIFDIPIEIREQFPNPIGSIEDIENFIKIKIESVGKD